MRILKVSGSEVLAVYVPGPKGPVFMNLLELTFGRRITTRTLDTVCKSARAQARHVIVILHSSPDVH